MPFDLAQCRNRDPGLDVSTCVEPATHSFLPLAFLWPALAAETASEFASAMAREFINLAVGPGTETGAPRTAICNAQQSGAGAGHGTVAGLFDRFRRTSDPGLRALCAPRRSDHRPGSSAQSRCGAAARRVERVFVTDWRSASTDMRLLSIDNYVASLNVLVDELGGAVDLVGLCPGRLDGAGLWRALSTAKVRKLVLAGAPIDIAAGNSKLSDLARNTPMAIFKELVDLGGSQILGHRVRQFWALSPLDREAIHHLLQSPDAIGSAAFRRLEARFHEWYAWTVDLPGTYYLQVVEQLFKENRLAGGSFEILGRPIDLAGMRCPLFLLAARDDDVVATEQIFAAAHLVDSRHCVIERAIAPCGHLGLFMGRKILAEVWPEIARWLLR